jgi:hypothetical protein
MNPRTTVLLAPSLKNNSIPVVQKSNAFLMNEA